MKLEPAIASNSPLSRPMALTWFKIIILSLLAGLAGLAGLIRPVMSEDVLSILRDDATGYAEVVKGRALVFPRDHYSHPDYRTEWWYLTANLNDQQGRQWGLQWTLFRQALSPDPGFEGWQSNQLWMAHAAITSPEGHFYEQRFARGGIGQAGVSLIQPDGYFNAWLDDWEWRSTSPSIFPAKLDFSVDKQRVSLQLVDPGVQVRHGDDGYSLKSAQGQASYYYSHPNIRIHGSIADDKTSHVVSGLAWLDREWSSQPLAPNQQGWDWFSLHLNNNEKLMLYQLRHDNGEHWLSGSWINGDGKSEGLSRNDIVLKLISSRKVDIGGGSYRKLPLEWQLEVPGKLKLLRLKPLYDQQWMGTQIPYWEGVVLVEDESGQTAGTGYMELTGYD